LAKPAVVPWAVNQVYWRARGTYNRLMKSGETLRAAQIASLEGRAADVRAASDAHRRAIGDAVAEAGRLAASTGAKPAADALARTFEALSLATHAPEWPGRLTDALQPAGFEALTGIRPRESGSAVGRGFQPRQTGGPKRAAPHRPEDTKAADEEKKERTREAARAAAEHTRREAEVKDAQAEVARAEAGERASRETWERAHDALLDARRRLAHLKSEI
jgi:hypothetical protein